MRPLTPLDLTRGSEDSPVLSCVRSKVHLVDSPTHIPNSHSSLTTPAKTHRNQTSSPFFSPCELYNASTCQTTECSRTPNKRLSLSHGKRPVQNVVCVLWLPWCTWHSVATRLLFETNKQKSLSCPMVALIGLGLGTYQLTFPQARGQGNLATEPHTPIL